MALYITSTANTGTGTLRACLEKVSSRNYIIQPHPDYFPKGTICEVTLTANLEISTLKTDNPDIILQGGQTRLVIDSQSQYLIKIGAYSYEFDNVTCIDIDFRRMKGSYSSGGINLNYCKNYTFLRCSFCGNSEGSSPVYNTSNTTESVIFQDCAFYGNRATYEAYHSAAGAILMTSSSASKTKVVNCTFGANYRIYGSGTERNNYNISPVEINVVNTAAQEAEWKAPPPSSYNYNSWTATAYQSMDPRPSVAASWKTGAVETTSTIDLDGNPRKNGGALGAYEYDAVPLSAPTGLNVDNITSNSATIGWNAVENASSYQITYTPSGGTSTTVTSSTNSVNITNLLNFTPYSVEVVAVGDGTTYSDSDPSSALTFTTLNQLATPTIDVSAEDDFGVAIQQIAGATTYHLQYRAQGTTAWTDITSSSNDIELPSSIPTGVVYEFRAYVSDSTGVALDSDFSDILTEKLFSTLTYKSIKTRTTSSISFNVSYLVSGRYVSEYKLRSSSEWTIIGSQTLPAAPSGNNVVVTSPSGLTPSTAYDFRVRLVRDDGESRWLNVSQVTKASVSAPPTPTCTVDGTTVYVQITPLEGYSWYQVIAYVNSPNETGAVRLPWTQTTNQTVTGLAANSYYFIRVQYRVTAENDAYENDSFRSMTQVLTGAPQLETPTGLESSNITSTSARIGWNGVYGAVDYLLEYRERGQTTWIVGGDELPLMSESATQLKAAIAEVGMAEMFGSVVVDADQFSISALFEISVSDVSDDATFWIHLDYPAGTSPGTDVEYIVVLMLVDGSNVTSVSLDTNYIGYEGDTTHLLVTATYEQLAAVEGEQAMLAILTRDSNAEATDATITDVSPDSTEITIVR